MVNKSVEDMSIEELGENLQTFRKNILDNVELNESVDMWRIYAASVEYVLHRVLEHVLVTVQKKSMEPRQPELN